MKSYPKAPATKKKQKKRKNKQKNVSGNVLPAAANTEDMHFADDGK